MQRRDQKGTIEEARNKTVKRGSLRQEGSENRTGNKQWDRQLDRKGAAAVQGEEAATGARSMANQDNALSLLVTENRRGSTMLSDYTTQDSWTVIRRMERRTDRKSECRTDGTSCHLAATDKRKREETRQGGAGRECNEVTCIGQPVCPSLSAWQLAHRHTHICWNIHRHSHSHTPTCTWQPIRALILVFAFAFAVAFVACWLSASQFECCQQQQQQELQQQVKQQQQRQHEQHLHNCIASVEKLDPQMQKKENRVSFLIANFHFCIKSIEIQHHKKRKCKRRIFIDFLNS